MDPYADPYGDTAFSDPSYGFQPGVWGAPLTNIAQTSRAPVGAPVSQAPPTTTPGAPGTGIGLAGLGAAGAGGGGLWGSPGMTNALFGAAAGLLTPGIQGGLGAGVAGAMPGIQQMMMGAQGQKLLAGMPPGTFNPGQMQLMQGLMRMNPQAAMQMMTTAFQPMNQYQTAQLFEERAKDANALWMARAQQLGANALLAGNKNYDPYNDPQNPQPQIVQDYLAGRYPTGFGNVGMYGGGPQPSAAATAPTMPVSPGTPGVTYAGGAASPVTTRQGGGINWVGSTGVPAQGPRSTTPAATQTAYPDGTSVGSDAYPTNEDGTDDEDTTGATPAAVGPVAPPRPPTAQPGGFDPYADPFSQYQPKGGDLLDSPAALKGLALSRYFPNASRIIGGLPEMKYEAARATARGTAAGEQEAFTARKQLNNDFTQGVIANYKRDADEQSVLHPLEFDKAIGLTKEEAAELEATAEKLKMGHAAGVNVATPAMRWLGQADPVITYDIYQMMHDHDAIASALQIPSAQGGTQTDSSRDMALDQLRAASTMKTKADFFRTLDTASSISNVGAAKPEGWLPQRTQLENLNYFRKNMKTSQNPKTGERGYLWGWGGGHWRKDLPTATTME